MAVPDLRKPSAPKRILWQETEVANAVIHGFMVQIAVALDGVILFGGNRPVFRMVRVSEDEPEPVLFEDYLGGGTRRLSLDTALEVCRTSKMAVEDLWRGELDLSERVGKAWQRHLELWREAHPLAMAPRILDVSPLARANRKPRE